MNKTININVGGLPFIIDDAAYFKLEAYLTSLEKHFKNSEGCEEIISDIESRIAEIFHERLSNRNIVESEDVAFAIEQMGTPDEMEEPFFEQNSRESNHHRASNGDNWSMKTGKRLFRDKDDQVIGGVCSGLAAYFGVHDPVWIRIAFAILGFGTGIGVLPYIIMWAIVPEAKTSGDRLEMKGEQVNVNNIARTIEEGFETLSDSLQDIGDNFRNKKKRKKENGNARRSSTRRFSILNREGTFEGSSLHVHTIGLGKTFKGLFVAMAIALIVTLILMSIASVLASIGLGIAASYVMPFDGWWKFSFAIPFILIITIPTIMLVRRMIRSIYPSPYRKFSRMGWVSPSAVTLGIIMLVSMAIYTAKDLSNVQTISSDLLSFEDDGRAVQIDLKDMRQESIVQTDFASIGLTELVVKYTDDIILSKSDDDQWHVVKHMESRGQTEALSAQNASSAVVKTNFKDGVLTLGNGYRLKDGDKFRGQKLTYEIKMPENAIVNFNRKSLFKIDCDAFPDHDLHKELIGKSFQMGGDKLTEQIDSTESLGQVEE